MRQTKKELLDLAQREWSEVWDAQLKAHLERSRSGSRARGARTGL